LDKLLSIGKILNFHGVQGEVKVGYTERQEQILTNIDKMFVLKGSKIISLTPEKIRFHKKVAIIKFKEINSIDEVIDLKGAYLKAPKAQIQKFLNKD
jgi:16S rRNA processing protein RimM